MAKASALPQPPVGPAPAPEPREPQAPPAAPRRSRVGTVSLLIAVAGAGASHAGLRIGPFTDATWLRIVASGFEAALVGALADWFAVTALFRRPLGLPIPHTDIIVSRRQRLIDGIVSTVENDWLAPGVIAAQLERFTPSEILVEWLRDPQHVRRLGAPVRDVLRAVARMLDEKEVVDFFETTLVRQLADIPIDHSLGTWLHRAVPGEHADAAFEALATSLANLADRPRTAAELQWWLNRSARKLRESGKRLVPFFLRRPVVQRKLVEAACAYASSEFRGAASDPKHPLRNALYGAIRSWANRLAAGDPEALSQVERLRSIVLESLEAGPVVRDALSRLRRQLEGDLRDPSSQLSVLIDRKLHTSIVDALSDPERSRAFDAWVRRTADELLRRHHHEIGRTVRENLESREPRKLVRQIEDQVGADLQFIRLNGAVVGGLIGLAIAVTHWLFG